MENIGCKYTCDIYSPSFYNGFCQKYQIQTIDSSFFYSNSQQEIYKWSYIYDLNHMDEYPTILGYTTYQYTYGVLKFNSGLYRFFQISQYSYATYLIGIKISITIFNEIPINCGIQFKINNIYFGSIYRNESGMQMHKLKLFDKVSYASYASIMNYTEVMKYDLITYLDIPKNSFLFSAVGNFTDNTAGWGMVSVEITSGYCPLYCQLCEVSFKCKTCMPGYYYYKGGSCIQGCSDPNQQLNGSYCQDFDDETPYSMFLVQEYLDTSNDPEQYSQYTLISKSGTNFLKGLDIYYSYWQSYRVFGGPFVWAQAKFKRVHNIVDPHHSLTIAFYILYGPTFPSNGCFIYTIENKSPVYKSTSQLHSTYSDGSKQDKVYERISHNTSTLTIYWECYGYNNEPINAYCGFYNYYIAVHKCMPYCLECTDQNTCTQWNSTYNSTVVKFSIAECVSGQYYDKEQVRCIQCLMPCLSCISKLDCLSCQSTYTLSNLGCTCKYNQYEESNQCYDCPIECNQCLSQTYCIECLISNNRQLYNGQCNCIDGYYPIKSNPQCLLCHQFCKTCTGPRSSECLTCNNIINIQNIGTTCTCPIGSYYQDSIQSCSNCHSSCQSCFSSAINGCLTCNSSLNRMLKGLKCECIPGYYELNNICTNCPNTEDSSLSQCYKLCNNNSQIWHTNTCSSCDLGFQLQQGECQPICGDSLIKGYEQCEYNNNVLDDLCYNCQYQCPVHCVTCDQNTTLPCPDICGDGYITGIEECEDGNNIQYDGCYNCKFQCQPSCTKCIKGQCQECATAGWFIDPTNTPWQCKERCGDQLIVGTEQCEDGNTIDTDGCKDCKYHCGIGCSSCDYTTGSCLSCEYTGFQPYSYYCKNICGDGLVVTDPYGYYSEQCDDGNTINYDGCSGWCQYQCQQSSICTNCVNNRCETCASKYNLSSNQICLLKCQSSCITCDTNGQGCLACQLGYDRIDNLCQSICGDGIVTDDEQCDDGNLILGDGCHFCQFSCQHSCLNCIQGLCYHCLHGYQLEQFKCYPICGDALQTSDEQCEIVNIEVAQKGFNSRQFTCDINCYICQLGTCQQCTNGYDLSLNQYQCIKQLENTFTLIDNCQIQIDQTCIRCENYAYFDQVEQSCKLDIDPFDICQYYLKISPDLYCNQCFEFCRECNQNSCIACQNGYNLDDNFQCVSFCEDGILVHDEQCEIQDQDCLNCMYYAPKFCLLYFLNLCYQCQVGYYLNEYSNACQSRCGDGIVAHDEECEDNNYIQFDGCYQCKYSCSQQCISCSFGQCQKCAPNYYLQQGFCQSEQNDSQCTFECKLCLNGQCQICDDQYFFNEYGVCVLECSENCVYCNNNGLCLQCPEDYELENNSCILKIECFKGLYFNQELLICEPICGDGYIAGQEDCDDQNLQLFDGCHQCKYQCDHNCSICLQGQCFECSENLDLIENKCYSKCQDICLNCIQGVCQLCNSDSYLNEYSQCIIINKVDDFMQLQTCGNGIVEEFEQCDDQNLINDDNCNNYCQHTCDPNCISCIDGVCYGCMTGWILDLFLCKPICGDLMVVGNEECDDGNFVSYDGCFQCNFQCTRYCEDCQNGRCLSCQMYFKLDQLNNQCNPISPDLVIYEQPDCKLLNNNQCILCQFGYLDQVTNICIIDYNMNKCSRNCKKCLLQTCVECEQGYYGNNCVPKCGDGIQVQEEECDDGSQYLLDSCLNCKFQCPQYCKQCAFGVCTLCQEGFYLDIVSNSCNSVCGDQIVALDEVCDDGNELRYDGCFQCNFQCQMECLNCYYGKCLQCESSLILVESKGICEEIKQCQGIAGLYYDHFSNDCVTKCGDGFVLGSEQCEDQNNIPYDGCYECKYQCDKLCSNCQKGECFECQVGYYLNGQKCETKCGDGIKSGDELCDDHNEIARDGCTSCKPDPSYKCEEDVKLLSYCYKCQENCEDCKLNIDKVECIQCKSGYFLKDNSCNLCSEKCEECENTPNNCTKCITDGCKKCDNASGFYLDKQLKSCFTKCGDNIIAGQEQCDDGNQTDKDGCNSKCEIEKEFLCKDGLCILPPKKQVTLRYSNSTTTNDIDLTLEDIYIEGICSKVKISIENFKQNEYKYNITKKEMQNFNVQSCQITFKFFKTILESNLIHLMVPLKENATRILEEDVREVVIIPRRMVYYNEGQKAQAQNVAATSSTFTFILQLIGPLTILLGGFNFFWTILDILTWINNFYFLNVDYPLNVKLFFNKLQWGDVFNIPDFISLNSPDDPYYFEAPPKFTEKDVNPLFLNNVQLFFGLYLLAIFAYICTCAVVSIIKTQYEQNLRQKHKISIFTVNPRQRSIYQTIPQQLSSNIIEIKTKEMPSIVKAIYKQTQDFKDNFRAKLLQIVGLVFLDICLASVLQLKNKCNKEYAIIQFNIFLAVVGIIFIYLVFRLYSFVCSQHGILYESKVFSKYYCSLYEGINTKQKLSRNYCQVNLFRKALFIFFTVYFYEVPLLQTALCCLTCFLNLALILYQNPFVSKSILVQIAVPDFCIFIIVLITVLLAIHDVSIILSFDQKYFIGWIILFFIVSSILVQLIFLFKQFFSEMKGRMISLKNMSCCLRNNQNN
ncbi:unnamed protein product [Paramecium octaurelia]|uniref:EGF-like domain-containing protein n=1 Tax=Paramecium octaurelia TaxID=43137 RepID=A0A8S1V1C8_PAROT|nr:unnamed protein product [Paramecium octaurelia]